MRQIVSDDAKKCLEHMNVFEKIKAVVLDVDGVLTDGSVLVLENGLQARQMSIRDGYALQLAVKKGIRVVIISGAVSEPVRDRLNKLGITEVFMGITDKASKLKELALQWKLTEEEIVFMGDDMPDLEVMQWVSFAACPQDAVAEIVAIAQYRSPYRGGEGCVRDLLEQVLKAQNLWHSDSSIAAR
jgi:3-deoxy-D-manno-octulosonate 8-phosphate phosphatase (KDO 8-P phosphatase)